MYHEAMIAKLSKTQVQNLLKGKSARIKHGKHHKLHLLPHQMEGLHKKHALGKAYTLKFTQDQITKHGSGLMQDAYNFVKLGFFIPSKHFFTLLINVRYVFTFIAPFFFLF